MNLPDGPTRRGPPRRLSPREEIAELQDEVRALARASATR